MKLVIGEVDLLEYGREIFYIFKDNKLWSISFNGAGARIGEEYLEDTDFDIKNSEIL